MRVWRICRRDYASDALSGKGGLFASGRWHPKGQPIVYTSASLALAALECLVHADGPELPSDLIQVEIDLPGDVRVGRIEQSQLPRTWRDHPAPAKLQELGSAWLSGHETAALQVPSAVIPEECNVLLNPLHPDATKFSVIRSAEFVYDPRLADS